MTNSSTDTQTLSPFKEWEFVKFLLWSSNEFDAFDKIRNTETPEKDLNVARKELRIEFNEWAKNQVRTINGKELRCNGFNRSLTLDEVLQLSKCYKLDTIHILQIEWCYQHHFEDAYIIKDFKAEKSLYDYKDFEHLYFNGLDEALIKVWNKTQEITKTVKEKVFSRFYEMGFNFCKNLSNYGVSGFFEFQNLAHIAGFIIAQGGFNEFNCGRVISSLQLIEKTIPRTEYGLNNSNTGAPLHKFVTNGTYVCVKIDYCKQEVLEKFKAWFEGIKNQLQEINKCDSIRYEFNLHEMNGADFELVMWWD